jgi:PAS domain S-box-containing protein
MDGAGPREGAPSRHARWVAMWREGVRASATAISLVDLETRRLIELSRCAAELFGTTPAQGAGLDYLAVTERPEVAAETFRLARDGIIDGIRGTRRFQRADGSTVEMQASGRVIRSRTGPDLALWAAGDPSPGGATAAPGAPAAAVLNEDVAAPALPSSMLPDLAAARVNLDDRWRVAHLTPGAAAVLDLEDADLRGTSLLDVIHAEDLAVLLFAFARATTDSAAGVHVRVRQPGGGWTVIYAEPSALERDEGPLPFALAVAPAAEPTRFDPRGLAGLSARQQEIAKRLLRGERVANIAAELFLSPSTVRNHLSAIFQAFDVHSQAEFIALWRAGSRGVDR